MTWHIDGPAWQAYAEGSLDPAAEAAVEMHVTGCATCQSGARTLMADDVHSLWEAVHTEITTPRLARPLRLLTRFGVPEEDLVVVGAAHDLLLSWSVAVGAAVCCAIVVGLFPVRFPGGPQALFLVLAPLIPVLAVVATFDATDPFREVTEAAPFSMLRLALLRTTAALTAAVPLTVAVTLTVPDLHAYFATWLLPGLMLTLTALIMLTWFTAWAAGAVVSLAWLAVAVTAASTHSLGAVATVAGQAACAAAVVTLLVLLVRTTTVQHARVAR